MSSRALHVAAPLWVLAAIFTSPFHTPTAEASTMWSIGEIDGAWTDSVNWKRVGTFGGTCENPQNDPDLPCDTEATYVGSTAMHPDVLPMVVDDDVVAGTLYVGGWIEEFDTGNSGSDPGAVGFSGTLDVESGSVDIGNKYIRVGTRGARGTIDHTGGTVNADLGVTLGFDAAVNDGGDGYFFGSGTYNLGAGVTLGEKVFVGLQALGVLNVDGGSLQYPGSGRLRVGDGYRATGANDPQLPGIGLLNLETGSVTANKIHVGVDPGSTGTIIVSGERYDAVAETGSWLKGSPELYVGVSGSGSVVQAGGTVEAKRLRLGEQVGGLGSYTIVGGLLDQTTATHTVYVGKDGVGHLTVIGALGEIDINGDYEQNGRSTLTVVLEETSPHITPIEVGGDATFASGAGLQVQADYGPSPDDEFVILTSSTGLDASGLSLVGPTACDWEIPTPSSTELKVKYTGNCP